ncbi:MAG TPA: hypothetical protein EYG86_02260 [Crocinitomicaceae bacterium]|nr:hypothetical protein [Crocinitomicaceae bacterium]
MNKAILSFAISVFLFLGFNSIAQHKHNHQNHSQHKAHHNWSKLGSRTVDYKLDKDVIHVGAKEGGFTKIKVEVRGGAVNTHKMVLLYMNGTKETITLKHNFSKNSGSRVIDIKGGKRLIKNITMFYDTKSLAKSKAVIYLLGRH